MIASSLHPDIASRAPAPSRAESRPRKPLVLLLCGLILSGVVAPPAADTASATPIGAFDPDELTKAVNDSLLTCASANAERALRMGKNGKNDVFKATLYAEILCQNTHNGVAMTAKEKQFLIDVWSGK